MSEEKQKKIVEYKTEEKREKETLYDVFERWYTNNRLSTYQIARMLRRGIIGKNQVFVANVKGYEIVSANLVKQPDAYELVILTKYFQFYLVDSRRDIYNV